tara:strand:+ start:126 stop:281 length:156 start_codon:yes stop_codon:yes gene_type:complete
LLLEEVVLVEQIKQLPILEILEEIQFLVQLHLLVVVAVVNLKVLVEQLKQV